MTTITRTTLYALALVTFDIQAAEYYVAPSGDDANSGTQAAPFATLERARQAAREPSNDGPRSVIVAGGTYALAKPFELVAADSGTEAHPVVWQAAPGATVRLSGGVALLATEFSPITDEIVLARLDPAVRGKALQFDLRGIGTQELGEFPEAFRGAPAVPELFFNDQRLTLARWPNQGWATVAGIVDGGTTHGSADQPPRGGIFEYDGDRPERWQVDSGVWLLGYWCFDWYEEAIQVQAVDREKRQITLARPAATSPNRPTRRITRLWWAS